MIKMFGLGVVLGMCLPVLAGYLFLALGGMPVTTTDAPLPFERYLAKKALKVTIDPASNHGDSSGPVGHKAPASGGRIHDGI